MKSPLVFTVAFLVPTAAFADDVVIVHIDDAESALRFDHGAVVCVAPCDRAVPRDARYVVENQRRSAPFELHGSYATIHVHKVTKSRTGAGAIIIGVALPASMAFIALGVAGVTQSNCGWFGCDLAHSFGAFAVVFGGIVGVGGLVAGAVVMATTSTKTVVDVTGTPPAAKARWTPIVATDGHGASAGVGLSF